MHGHGWRYGCESVKNFNRPGANQNKRQMNSEASALKLQYNGGLDEQPEMPTIRKVEFSEETSELYASTAEEAEAFSRMPRDTAEYHAQRKVLLKLQKLLKQMGDFEKDVTAPCKEMAEKIHEPFAGAIPHLKLAEAKLRENLDRYTRDYRLGNEAEQRRQKGKIEELEILISHTSDERQKAEFQRKIKTWQAEIKKLKNDRIIRGTSVRMIWEPVLDNLPLVFKNHPEFVSRQLNRREINRHLKGLEAGGVVINQNTLKGITLIRNTSTAYREIPE